MESEIQQKIVKLKNMNNAIIFAHNYQRPEIQDVADAIGDSLFLAKKIQKVDPNKNIIYATVKFMAETGVLLNPRAKIYFPVPNALCPMALFCTPRLLKKYKKNNPDIPIVMYINSSTEAKQYADVVCTSSNAVEIFRKILEETGARKLAFAPDRNLGTYVQKQLGIHVDILPEKGHCRVHEDFSQQDMVKFRDKHPNAKIIVHPECINTVVEAADYVGSTSGLSNYVYEHSNEEIGIGTEIGLSDRLKRENSRFKIHPLKEGAICYAMKQFTLESILFALNNLDGEVKPITLNKELAQKAKRPVEKMFSLMEE